MRSLLFGTLFAIAGAGSPAFAQSVAFGINTKYDQGATGPATVDRIRDVGVTINRDAVNWQTVETAAGGLVWPARYTSLYAALGNRGIRSTVILTTRNARYDNGRFPTSPAAVAAYARFAAFAARTLGRSAIAFEIGNEFRPSEGMSGMTTSRDYVTLFVAAANAIHAVDPAAKVVADPAIFANAPATVPLEAGTPIGDAARQALQVADGVVVHQYPYQFAGVTLAQAQSAMVAAMTRRAAWLEALAGRPIPLYVTEYGWPRIAARGLSGQEQARQLAATTRALAAMPFVRVAIVYELADSCTDPGNIECTFGLYARGPKGLVAKPVMAAFRGAVAAAAR